MDIQLSPTNKHVPLKVKPKIYNYHRQINSVTKRQNKCKQKTNNYYKFYQIGKISANSPTVNFTKKCHQKYTSGVDK